MSLAAVGKFRNHLWYLTPETAAIGFFDSNVPIGIKTKMGTAIVGEMTEAEICKQLIVKDEDLQKWKTKDFSDLINPNSRKLFVRFGIDSSFLGENPKTWEENSGFLEGRKIMKSLTVVNDVAERGVKLMSDFNTSLSKNEDQVQFILQTVSDYRKRHPKATKSTLKTK